MNHVLPADTFIVINKTAIQDDSRILVCLYQPLIGAVALNMYNALCVHLDKLEMMSVEHTHNALLNNMLVSINELTDARIKLEGIGLIKTYVKQGSVNNYVYELYSPMSAKEFLENPILSTALYNAIGDVEYRRVKEFFKTPIINLRNYEDITAKFTDVFAWTSSVPSHSDIGNVRSKTTRSLEIISKIDINTILSMIPEEILNHKSVTKDVKEYLTKISFIYDYDNEHMVELIRNSITDSHTIDKSKLRSNANNYYKFDNMGKLPGLIYKNQPEYLRSNKADTSNRTKIIHLFETTSPYDFISSKYKSGNPTNSDLNIIAYLLLDLDLKPGVVNVLIDYVLKINKNKLNKAFIDVIAAQWKKSNIEAVEDAMNIAEQEYQKRTAKSGTTTYNRRKTDIQPKWFNQDIQEENATEEQIKELEELIGS